MRVLTDSELMLVAGGFTGSSNITVQAPWPNPDPSPQDGDPNDGWNGGNTGNDGHSPEPGTQTSDYNLTDAAAQDLVHFKAALDHLHDSGKAVELLRWAAEHNVTIHIIHDGDDRSHKSTNEIWWDPTEGIRTTDGKLQSAALGLIHELAHIYGDATDRPDINFAPGDPDFAYGSVSERDAIKNWETPIANDLHESTRSDDLGTITRMSDSVGTTPSS